MEGMYYSRSDVGYSGRARSGKGSLGRIFGIFAFWIVYFEDGSNSWYRMFNLPQKVQFCGRPSATCHMCMGSHTGLIINRSILDSQQRDIYDAFAAFLAFVAPLFRFVVFLAASYSSSS